MLCVKIKYKYNTILYIYCNNYTHSLNTNEWNFILALYLIDNYTLYKNAGFWLVNSRDIFFLQIQALHCEFAEFLLHVGVFA
jgi:hypothetical protein